TVGSSCGGNQGNGCEASTLTDPDHCGAGGAQNLGCLIKCASTNIASRTCGAGVCNGVCAAGFAGCNGNKQTDGCGKNVAVDPDNCGAGGMSGPIEGMGQGAQGAGCGVVCSMSHMATRTCSGGLCNGNCSAGFADCNMNKQVDG